MNESSSEIAGFRAAPSRRFRLRPWVLLCLLILIAAMALGVAEHRWGTFFFYITHAPDGHWAVVDKTDSHSLRQRISISMLGTGSLHTDWTIITIYDDNGRPLTMQGSIITPNEARVLALQALDRLEFANARLEGTKSTAEYRAALNALRTMLAGNRDHYVDNLLGQAVEKTTFLLVFPAIAGLLLCFVIAANRGSQRAALLRRLAKIEQQRCPTCSYDLRGVPADNVAITCPECGLDITQTELDCRARLAR